MTPIDEPEGNPARSPLTRRSTLRGMLLPAAALLLTGCSRAVSAERSEDGAGEPVFPDRIGASVIRPDGRRVFRNHRLVNQDGDIVRFQDDLIEGRVFAANFMYVHCKGICPNMTARMIETYGLLRPVMGDRLRFYSFSLAEDPAADLRAYMRERGIDRMPGWQFLSGTPEVIKDIRWAFGLYDINESVDNDLSQHTGMARFGNHPIDKWSACPILGSPQAIARGLLAVLPPSERPSLPGIYLEEGTRPARAIAGWKEPVALHSRPMG